jgi:hypothetical protein
MYSSVRMILQATVPFSSFPVRIEYDSSTHNERIRSQSRFCPAGPDMDSYSASMIVFVDDTSLGFAFKLRDVAGALPRVINGLTL